MNLIDHLADDPSLQRLAALSGGARPGTGAQRPRPPTRVVAQGSAGSSASLVAGALSKAADRPVLFIVAHLDEADESLDELLSLGLDAARFPALEALPGESAAATDLFIERLALIRRIVTGGEDAMPRVLVAPIQALMQPAPAASTLDALARTVRKGNRLDPVSLHAWLIAAGYERVDAVEEPGDFAVRGGITDIFPPVSSGALPGAGVATSFPIRLDFFGDEVERITEIDLATMASDREIAAAEIPCADPDRLAASGAGTESSVSFTDYLPRETLVVLHELMEVTEQARGYFERVSDGRTIFGPPAVLKALQAVSTRGASSFIEINQFSTGLISGDALVELPVRALEPFAHDVSDAVKELAAMSDSRAVAVFAATDAERSRFGELVAEFAPDSPERLPADVAYISRGFVWGESDPQHVDGPSRSAAPLAVVPYHEMLHRFETRRRGAARGVGGAGGSAGQGRIRASRAMDSFLDFAPGDFVVHRDHGIARFVALTVMQPREVKKTEKVVLPGEKAAQSKAARRAESGESTGPGKHITPGRREADPDAGLEEYLTLEFAHAARLHVPCTKIDQVQKYVGGMGGRGTPTLSILGGNRWAAQKERVAESVKDLAGELLRVRAAREHLPGIRFPADTAWQKEFEAEFPWQETDDQIAAIAEIKKDMQRDRPMDRLLCGDVGYGKTELAIRAAFKAVESGRQAAVLVPTTVLAEQHERTFRSRFADYPFRVESLSRFKTTQEVNAILADVRKGHVDVVIGTHRLLSKDVKFNDLGLVCIDEEQRFGVEHKERLLSLRMTVDVLTLSATPIPRTLHMSMLGLRDISSLATAPLDRRAVVTEVIPYNPRRIQQAIRRELARDGQVFFVHNRVYDIVSVADDIQKLAGPDARVVIGHGQMPDGELEEVMLAFMRRRADILVSTTIIESGIDIPTANTMFINNAERFGLADLHQLRGRVGRGKHRGYCYMLTDPEKTVPEKAIKRLKAIEEFSMLGAGFKIAMRDLEIRGAGNILGPEQSGHIAAVGYEMYCQLLDRAVKDLRSEPTQVASETAVELGITGLIPKRYILSDLRRLEAYRRIATCRAPEDVRKVEEELRGAYGEPPEATRRLLDLAELRAAASAMRVRTIALRGRDVLLRVPPAAAEAAAERLRTGPGQVTVLPPKSGEESAEIFFRPPDSYLKGDAGHALLMALRKRFTVQPGIPAPAR